MELWKETRQGREQEKEGGRKSGKCWRETTGESEIWETRIAQPQIGPFTGRMYKHTAEFLWEIWLSYEWIVCLSATETMWGATHETVTETVKTKGLMWMNKEQLVTAKTHQFNCSPQACK